MLKAWRQENHFSQRELARRSGVAYKTIQLIESGRNCRLSTLAKLAKTMDLPGPEALFSRKRGFVSDAATGLRRIPKKGWETAFFDFVDGFRRSSTGAEIVQAPPPGLTPRGLALVASAIERLCAERGMPAPWWCAAAPALEEPWFVRGRENA